MQKFYFNTGVVPHKVPNFPYEYHKKQGDEIRGTLLIPFYCEDVPAGAVFKFACDNPDLPEAKSMLVREIHNSNLISKFAYFATK